MERFHGVGPATAAEMKELGIFTALDLRAKDEAFLLKSRVRARVEHVFGVQQTSPGGRIVRTIGIVRARAKIGLQNLVYNIRRLVTLERMAVA